MPGLPVECSELAMLLKTAKGCFILVLPFHWYLDDDGVDDYEDADRKNDCAILHDSGVPAALLSILHLYRLSANFIIFT